MKKIYFYSFVTLFPLVLLAGHFVAKALPDKVITNEPLSVSEIRETISAGVTWFKAQQEDSGHFRYEYIPFLDRYSDDDNIVRQAGALYELSEIMRHDETNQHDLEEVIKKAIDYFVENTVDGSLNGYDFKCVLKDDNKCTLGGTSLALIGVINYVERDYSSESEYMKIINGYKNYFLAMKNKSVGFSDSYSLTGAQSKTESSFSNGEAFLALTRYYQYKSDENVKTVIDQSFDYFLKEYGTAGNKNYDNNFYLWGMAAIKDLDEISPRDEYFEYVKNYTNWRIDSQRNNRVFSRNRCAYIEGVVSAYSVLKDRVDETDQAYYEEEINFWLTKSRALQIIESDFLLSKMRLERFTRVKLVAPGKAVGGFLTDFSEPAQRIDFTQHCLSSYLQKLVDIDGEALQP